jgi:hypothetical protein
MRMRTRLIRFANWLQPDNNGGEESGLTGFLVNFTLLLLVLPTAVFTIVWLIVITDFAQLMQPRPLILLLLAIAFALIAFPLWNETGPIFRLWEQLSFAPLVYFSAILIWGAEGIWLIPVTAGLIFLWELLTTHLSWPAALQIGLSRLAGEGLAAVAAQQLFSGLGGTHPYPGWPAASLAVTAAAVVWLLWPLLFTFIVRLLLGGRELAVWMRTAVLPLLIHTAATLFAIFAAGLYRNNPAAYLIFLLGALLMSFLSNRIYARVAAASRKMSQLALLEAVGRQVLEPGTGKTALQETLAEVVPQLFPGGSGEIRLFPHEILYDEGAQSADPLDAIWPQREESNVNDATGAPQPRINHAWESFLVAIPDLDGDEPCGAIGLSRPLPHGPAAEWIPLQSSWRRKSLRSCIGISGMPRRCPNRPRHTRMK